MAHLDFSKHNDVYATTFRKGELNLPPAKKYIVVTCMDARLEPASQLGIELGDAHVIRNAGGVVKDALRSIVISQRLLGTREIAVVHHTGCGMLLFTSDKLRKIVKDAEPQNTAAAEDVDRIDFLEFGDLEQSVKDDVKLLQDNPLVLNDTTVSGWIYDVKTGKINRIV